jgi:hypothetical protein
VNYGSKHPELKMSAFTILQVPGTVRRSHSVDGVAESLVKSKKYLLPLVVLQPEFAGALAVGYLSEGRLHLPKNAPVFEIGDLVPANAQDAATPVGGAVAVAAEPPPPGTDPPAHAPAVPPPVPTEQ